MGLVRLGVNFRNLDGSMKKPLDTLKDLSARFSKMSLVRSLALGKKLGLDEPTIRLLQKGRKGLDELIAKYKDLGVMSAEDVKNGAKLNKVFQDYRQIITFLGMRMAGYFLPIAEKISNWFIKAAKWVKDNERVFKAAITTIGAVITASLIKPILALVSNPVLMGIAALSAAIMLIVEDFMAWKEGADSLFGPLYEWLSKKIPEAWKWVNEVFEEFINWFKTLDEKWPNLFIAFERLKKWFLDLTDNGKIFAGVFDVIKIAIDTVIETIKTLFGWFTDLMGWFDKIGEKLGGKIAEWVVGEKIEDNNLSPAERMARMAMVQQMASVYDNAPAVAAMQTTNRTMNNNDNSKTWRVERVEVNNNFTTPIPQNMQRGVADAFSTPVLQNDIW